MTRAPCRLALFLSAMAVAMLPAAARGDAPGGPPPDTGALWASMGYLRGWNGDVSAGAMRVAAGYDRLFENGRFGVGGRTGVISGGGALRPLIGAHAMWWTADHASLGPRLRLGLAADLWIETEDGGDPVYLYVAAETGVRIPLGKRWFADVPIELGILPQLSPKVYELHVGLAMTRAF
jgi:hypothetical protein